MTKATGRRRALAPAAIVPLIVLFLMLQRYWKTGLAAGSLK